MNLSSLDLFTSDSDHEAASAHGAASSSSNVNKESANTELNPTTGNSAKPSTSRGKVQKVQKKLKKPYSKNRSARAALNNFETTASSDEDLILASRQFEQASTSVPTSRSAPALVLEDDDDDDISLLDIGVLRQPRRKLWTSAFLIIQIT